MLHFRALFVGLITSIHNLWAQAEFHVSIVYDRTQLDSLLLEFSFGE